MRQPELADTLDRLADAGAGDLYRGQLADAVVAFSDEAGAALTARDLAGYRVIRRRPVEVTVPRPPDPHERAAVVRRPAAGVRAGAARPAAAGGRPARRAGSAGAGGDPARGRGPARTRARAHAGPQRRAAAARTTRSLERGRARLLADLRSGPQPVAGLAAPRGTSHVSVVDAAGNAVAMTSSTGCGSGVFAGQTGLHLNNMLGEEDLTGHGQPRPGERLTSMMSPTIAEGPDGSVLVAGVERLGADPVGDAPRARRADRARPRAARGRRPAADPRHAGGARLRVRLSGRHADASWSGWASA